MTVGARVAVIFNKQNRRTYFQLRAFLLAVLSWDLDLTWRNISFDRQSWDTLINCLVYHVHWFSGLVIVLSRKMWYQVV